MKGISMKQLRVPSPATVLATVAVFAAFAGGAYAGNKVKVNSKTVQNNSLKSVDIKDGVGVGASDLTAITAVRSAVTSVADAAASNDGDWGSASATATCPAGAKAISGGVEFTGAGDELAVQDSLKAPAGEGWFARVISDDTASQDFQVIAYCLAK
jgi:hypothetical protein